MALPKLVRDNIPEIISNDGREPVTRILTGEEYQSELVRKLGEEYEEFCEDLSVEELADILEVVYALASVKGIDQDGLERIRETKALKNGSFEKKIILEEIR